MFDVITIGAATRDVFLSSEKFIALKSRKFPTGAGECVALGSKVEVDELVLTTGGGATNAAATFASLGFHAAVMTRIGDDAHGKDVIDDLTAFGVSTHFVRMIKNGQTGFSVLLTMKDGERTVLVYRGVSSQFDQKDIQWGGCEQTRWIYLTSLGGNVALAKKILDHARRCNINVAWNPGVGELKQGLKTLTPFLPMVNVLIMNLEEAKLITQKREVKTMFKMLHSDGTVRLITDGTQGSYIWKDGWMVHAATTGIKAISRTGAGDAFGSGFVAAFIKTNDLKQALAIGTLNAESVVQQFGAKRGILKKWPSGLAMKKIRISDA